MKIRKEYGDKNLIGKKVYKLRTSKGIKQKDFLAQMQVRGIDISSSTLSDIEGQIRLVTDKEIKVIAKVLGVSYEYLLDD